MILLLTQPLRRRLLVPVLLVPLTLSACGGGDGSAKAAYIKAAESVCAKANADQKALTRPTGVAQLPPYVAMVVDIADRASTDLLSIKPPPKDAKALKAKLLDPLREQVTRGHAYAAQVAAAAKKNDQAALLRLLGNPPTDTKADLRWMKGYGFSSCVDAADTSG